jgi:hypothetical protein
VHNKQESDLDFNRQFVKAHKAATVLYDQERGKSNGGMSVRQVEKAIKSKHKGYGPSSSTIHHYVVNLGLVGMSPRKTRSRRQHPCIDVQVTLCGIWKLYAYQSDQCIGGDYSRIKMIPVISEAMNLSISSATELIQHFFQDTAIDMKADKMYFAEERRVRWTIFSNLELWFKSWEKTLLDLGLLEQDESGKLNIPKAQLRNILNFDKTCLSLDGSSINRGGRPAAYYHDPRLPQVGISTSKMSQTITMIIGSNSWGEALPPHFQFMFSAKTDEGKQVWNDCIRYMQRTIGNFGLGEEKSLPVSIGMNEKGGMDKE